MTKPIDPTVSVEYILANSPEFAQAKAKRIYLEEFRKSKKAMLMCQSPAKSAVEREQFAYAHPEYTALLLGIKAAVETEETTRWGLIAAQATIEIWRTQCANNRSQDRNLQ